MPINDMIALPEVQRVLNDRLEQARAAAPVMVAAAPPAPSTKRPRDNDNEPLRHVVVAPRRDPKRPAGPPVGDTPDAKRRRLVDRIAGLDSDAFRQLPPQ